MIIRILIRNAFRHKLRSILTITGIAIAILAYGLLHTVIDAWYAGVAASSANRLVTRNSISLVFRLPLSYREKIRSVDGVEIVSYGNWFGGYYRDEKDFFANFAVEPVSYLNLYPEYKIAEREKTSFLKNRKGCIAGKKLTERFGWEVGDSITLTGTIYPGKWEFVLSAVYKGKHKNVDETMFFFHWDYLNETLKKERPFSADNVGFYMIGIDKPENAASIAEAIDTTFKNSLAETLTETEKAFQLGFVAMSETILKAIQLVSFVIIVIILVVVANTMVMSVRERTAEYAVLKTIGFSGGHIAALIIGESMTITLIGGVFGILATYPAATVFSNAVGDYFPVFNITKGTILMDAAVTVIVGLSAGVVPAWGAMSIRIAEGLRRIG
ncbi:MAG: FtsX-like permease family protein [Candidatus Kuenenia sp.]|nr:FtsX-like permease family protein [Candidatus Kuenenia hertensis]